MSASYRGANPEGTKRWLEIEEHARQPNAPVQPTRSPNTFAKLDGITTRTLVVAADADPPGSACPHAIVGSPREGRPVGDGAGCGPFARVGAARCFQRHRIALLEGRVALSECPVVALGAFRGAAKGATLEISVSLCLCGRCSVKIVAIHAPRSG